MRRRRPQKQPTPKPGPLPSTAARTFYQARRIKELPDGRKFSVQNYTFGKIFVDHYGSIYEVSVGGALKLRERKEITRLRS